MKTLLCIVLVHVDMASVSHASSGPAVQTGRLEWYYATQQAGASRLAR